MNLQRSILILMATACVVNIAAIIHCHVNDSATFNSTTYQRVYSILFPVLLTMTSFFLIEQLNQVDGTIEPLNRLRCIYSAMAAFVLFFFAAAGFPLIHSFFSWHQPSTNDSNKIIAAALGLISMLIYLVETLARARNRRTE